MFLLLVNYVLAELDLEADFDLFRGILLTDCSCGQTNMYCQF